MVVPLTVEEQKLQNYFSATKKIGLYVGVSDYSNLAIKINNRPYPIPKLEGVDEDVRLFKECMEKYSVSTRACLIDKTTKDAVTEVNKIN